MQGKGSLLLAGRMSQQKASAIPADTNQAINSDSGVAMASPAPQKEEKKQFVIVSLWI